MERPPKPPRVPPMLYSWSAVEHYVLTLSVLCIDIAAGFAVAVAGASDLTLAMFAFASTCAIWSCYRTVRHMLFLLREWRELRRAWDELDAFMTEREQRK